MLRKILYLILSIIVFFAGMLAYGMILHSGNVPLSQAMREKHITQIEDAYLLVDKTRYRLYLYSEKTLIKSYIAVFGKNRSNIKLFSDDYSTPVGNFKICDIDTNSYYRKFFQINFPLLSDAAEALKNGYIDNIEYEKIQNSIRENDCPFTDTKLGAKIGIHGIGTYDFVFKNLPFVFNWTNGSIAVSNEDIEELYSVVNVGTKVTIIE